MAGEKIDANELRARGQRILGLDYFAALGVERAATTEQIQKAFIEAAKTWHPDRLPTGSEDVRALAGKVFARLELARGVLADPARRVRYIEELKRPKTGPASERNVDPSALEASVELKKAEVLLKKNDTVTAEQHLRRAIQLQPTNLDAQVLLLSLRLKPGASAAELGTAAEELDKIIARDPKHARAFFVRAQARKRLDRVTEAMTDFKRAAELDPQNLDAAREVRIHEMRQRSASAEKPPAGDAGEAGTLGFFRRLFKR